MKQKYKIIGYASDGSLKNIRQEDASKLTHLNIAFGHVVDAEITVAHMKELDQLQEIKKMNPDITILLSVGGWSAGGFSEGAATSEGRDKMITTGLEVLKNYPFDGIDLDWEYPTIGVAGIEAMPEDKQNFTALLKGFRKGLDDLEIETGKYYFLTIAVGCDEYYTKGTEMSKIEPYLDYVQLMTYDMRGGYQVLTGHHTNLYTPIGDVFTISVDKSVELFRKAGIPREKLIIGAAFYSRMWKGVPNVNNGYLQFAETAGGFGPEFTELDAEYINKNGFTRFWDDEAKAPYLFNGDTFITYEDEESIQNKCKYLMHNGLGGIMFWEYKCDYTHKLLNTMDNELKGK